MASIGRQIVLVSPSRRYLRYSFACMQPNSLSRLYLRCAFACRQPDCYDYGLPGNRSCDAKEQLLESCIHFLPHCKNPKKTRACIIMIL